MSRSFYSAAASLFGEEEAPADFECIVLAEHGANLFLHSAMRPNVELAAAGGVLLGATWPEMKAAVAVPVRKKVFRVLAERDVGPVTVTLFIPEQAVKPGDTVLASGLPPHKFLGDPDPEPRPVG